MGLRARTERAFIIGAVTALSCVGLVPPAGAATTWVRSPAPNPSPLSNLPRAIDCTDATTCTAVGMRYDGGAFQWRSLVVRTTNGANWASVPTPRPEPGWTGNQLESVSCQSATQCTAVGYASGTAIHPVSTFAARSLILRTTNGTTWARVAAPSSGGRSSLFGVSCATATECTAVGNVDTKTLVLQTTDGVTWERRRTPNPGAGINRLNAVSCVSAVACTAVGYFSHGDEVQPRRTLVLRTTDGVTWTRVKSPNPSGDPGLNQLTDVSCVGPSTCVAVGLITRDASSVRRALVLRTTDGATWNRLTATPTTLGEIDLSGVSCSSPTTCTTVGAQRNATNTSQAPFIAQTTNGTTWVEVPSPNPGGFSRPQSVSCAVVDHCYATGEWEGSKPHLQLRTLILKET